MVKKYEQNDLNKYTEKEADRQKTFSGRNSTPFSEISCFVEIPVLHLIPTWLGEMIQIFFVFFIFVKKNRIENSFCFIWLFEE